MSVDLLSVLCVTKQLKPTQFEYLCCSQSGKRSFSSQPLRLKPCLLQFNASCKCAVWQTNLVFSSPFESCFNTPSPFLYKIHFYCPESQIVAVIGQHRCKGEIFARSESRCRYLHLAKNTPHKILRSSIFTSSRGQLGRPSMPSTHSDTHARTTLPPLPPSPQEQNYNLFFQLTSLHFWKTSQ